MLEEWRAVVGFPGYEVSDHGRVRSLDRDLPYERRDQYSGRVLKIVRKRRGQMLRPGTVKSGHQLVVLGKGNGRFVHKLVLEAFVGPAPEGTECCHFDDKPANNLLGNLRWGTRAANIADYNRNYGRYQQGGAR